MISRDDILASVFELPPFPPVATRVLAMLQQERYGAEDLAKIIELDPSLTTKVMRIANGAILGFVEPAKSMRDALVRLGWDRVRQVVIASAVSPYINTEISGYGLQQGDLWRHSIAVAFAAELLAPQTRIAPGLAFTAGLLHDIGKLVMSKYVLDRRTDLDLYTTNGFLSYEEAEVKVFRISHAELGAEVLTMWRFPLDIIEAVRWHHEPENASVQSPLVEIVNLANALALICGVGVGNDGLRFRVSPSAIERFDLSPRKIAELLVQVESRLDAAKEMLDLERG